MEDGIKDLVDNLLKERSMSIEDKILEVYKYICLNYIYDVNVLYFFRKDKSDINNVKYIAVDWYGRIIGEDWKEKRKNHNRRICYEFARFYAKAINTLIDGNNELEAFMLGLKDNTHYVVGLTYLKYSIRFSLFIFFFASSTSSNSSFLSLLKSLTAFWNFPVSSLNIFIPLIVNPNFTLVRSFILLKSSKSKTTLYSFPVKPTT